MKKPILFIILAIFTISLIIPATLPAATRGIRVVSKGGQDLDLYESYHALVVGISDYKKWPDLPYAVSDAKEVAQRLKKMGFEVRLVLNPDSRELKRAINEMTYRMGQDENRAVLFYYAGHGETETMADETKMGYIIPKDCPVLKKDPIGFNTHAISMREIESVSLRIRSKHVLMLFDSCFSGALFALVRAVPDDITEKSTLPVRQYITAGRENEQVPDKSMFKRCFLIGLKGGADLTGDGYITGSEMGMYLADNVVNYTRRRQHPQYGKINNPDLDQGDFVFVPLKTLEKRKRQEGLIAEKDDLATDIEKLRAERHEAQKVLEEMKKLLQGKLQAEEQKKKTLSEKRALEKQVALLAKERETIERLADTRIKEYEAKLSNSKERTKQEAEKRKALEEELKRVRLEKEKAARQKLALQTPPKERPETISKPLPQPQAQKAIVEKGTFPKTPLEIPVTKANRQQEVASLHVPEVKPEKDLTTLIVTSNVRDAKIYIDKKEVSFWASPDEAWIYCGTAPFKTQEISPGRHEIRVHEKGYEEEVKIVEISPGETVELDVTLFKVLSETGDEDHGGGGGGGGGSGGGT